mgnify:CR=1 FL=1
MTSALCADKVERVLSRTLRPIYTLNKLQEKSKQYFKKRYIVTHRISQGVYSYALYKPRDIHFQARKEERRMEAKEAEKRRRKRRGE